MSTGQRFKALLDLLLRFLRWISQFNKPKNLLRRRNGWLDITRK